MAGPYYIYSGAEEGAGTGADWTNAFTSFKAMQDYGGAGTGPSTSSNVLAATDTVYVASDHDDSGASYAASLTIYGPTAGPGVKIISLDRSDDSYLPGSATNQIDTRDNSAYVIAFDGSFHVYGLTIAPGSADNSMFANDLDEQLSFEDCIFRPPHNGRVRLMTGSNAPARLINCTIDHDYDTGAATAIHRLGGFLQIIGLTTANSENRTGSLFQIYGGGHISISGGDFSDLTNVTLCELFSADSTGANHFEVSNCLTAATWEPLTGPVYCGAELFMTNVGPEDAPAYLFYANKCGTVETSTSVTRTGGAEAEGVAHSWQITTTTSACEGLPLCTPWIYGVVASSGSKTFDIYITHDADISYDADLTDAEAWMELEYLADTDEAQWTLVTDHRATIMTSAAAQADDAAGLWSTAGDYEQKLSVNATIGETGQFRARVCVAGDSSHNAIGSGHNFYVDPKVHVT